tara:strand:- start:17607 stop:18461 length:855 start_codon:yes stop_codon:yes gene_type:complete
MHELAKISMRGSLQAILLASISMLVPMMFWFSAAVVALVTLRKGFNQGAVVFFWTILPAMVWLLSVQDPGALIILALSFLMANILRITSSWQATLVSGALVSLILGWISPYIMPDLIEVLMSLADEFFKELAKQSDQEYNGEMQQGFQSLMIAGFASSFFGIAIGSVCLARSWQARLFNPGGWQEEFYQIRIQPRLLFLAFSLIVITPVLGLNVAVVIFTAIILLIFSGIALVHGLVAKKKMTIQWLIGFYISVFVLFPTMLMLVAAAAVIDSFIDLRSRVSES